MPPGTNTVTRPTPDNADVGQSTGRPAKALEDRNLAEAKRIHNPPQEREATGVGRPMSLQTASFEEKRKIGVVSVVGLALFIGLPKS